MTVSINYSMATKAACQIFGLLRHWHSCDIKPEGCRPKGFTSQQHQYLPSSPHCNAITNLLHAPDWMSLNDLSDKLLAESLGTR